MEFLDDEEDDVIDGQYDPEDRFTSILKEREVSAPQGRDFNQDYFLWCPIEDAESASPTYPAGYHGVIGRTIPNQLLERCVITPCVTGRFQEPLPPSHEMYPLMTEVYAGHDAEQLVRAERSRGTIYFECLLDKNYSHKWVMQQKFHKAIFPIWPKLPDLLMPGEDPAPNLYQYLQERQDLINREKTAVAINPKLTLNIIDEMLVAVKNADTWARERLRESNTFIDLDSKDANWKPGYDHFDMLLFTRTGMVPRKDALDRLAKDRTVRVEIPEQKLDPALVVILQNQNAMMEQLAKGQNTLAEAVTALATKKK